MKEFTEIVLTVDRPERGLVKGDVGVIVEVYGKNEGYEVEFMTKEGKTVAVVTLDAHEVRPIGARDILHERIRIGRLIRFTSTLHAPSLPATSRQVRQKLSPKVSAHRYHKSL